MGKVSKFLFLSSLVRCTVVGVLVSQQEDSDSDPVWEFSVLNLHFLPMHVWASHVN